MRSLSFCQFFLLICTAMACKTATPQIEGSELHDKNLAASWQDQVTVMTFNIAPHMKPDLDKIASEIEAANADLVGLQEVDLNTLRNRMDMAGEIAKKTGMHVAFASARPHVGGKFGNAVLSRGRLRRMRF